MKHLCLTLCLFFRSNKQYWKCWTWNNFALLCVCFSGQTVRAACSVQTPPWPVPTPPCCACTCRSRCRSAGCLWTDLANKQHKLQHRVWHNTVTSGFPQRKHDLKSGDRCLHCDGGNGSACTVYDTDVRSVWNGCLRSVERGWTLTHSLSISVKQPPTSALPQEKGREKEKMRKFQPHLSDLAKIKSYISLLKATPFLEDPFFMCAEDHAMEGHPS